MVTPLSFIDYSKGFDMTEVPGGAQLSFELERPPVCNTGVGSGFGVERWGAHIDWYTGTCEAGRGQDRWPDQDVLMQMIEAYGSETMKVWRMQGYDGFSVGQVSWAQRQSGTIRQITSDQAHQYVLAVGHDLGRASCTRLDITCDITLMGPTASFIQNLAAARADISGVERLGAPLLISSYGRGDTYYVGSPASAKRLRIYDKYLESGGEARYERTIRYELQLRKPHSDTFVLDIGGDADVERKILATVAYHCKRTNVYFPTIDCDTDPIPLRVDQVEKGVDRQLEWLRSQVAPTVRRLVATGHRDRVVAALGLTNEVIDAIIHEEERSCSSLFNWT